LGVKVNSKRFGSVPFTSCGQACEDNRRLAGPLALKQALGREYDGVRRVLAHLDQFVTTHGGDLTAETFAGWCLTLQHLASGTRRKLSRPQASSSVLPSLPATGGTLP
jgi:hypothetical protein